METGALLRRRTALIGVGAPSVGFSAEGVRGAFYPFSHTVLACAGGSDRMYDACRAKQEETITRQTAQKE